MKVSFLIRIIVELLQALFHDLITQFPQILLHHPDQLSAVFKLVLSAVTSDHSIGPTMSTINISKSPNLWIKVTELDETAKDGNGDHPIKATAIFGVEREVLTKKSTVRKMLVDSTWKESEQDTIDMQDKVDRLRVVFTVLHEVESFLDVKFPFVWHLIEGIDYYHIDIEPFEAWFAHWSKSTNDMFKYQPQAALFPTWRFCQSQTFARATKHLAYNAMGHIMEKNPTGLKHLHLPPRVIRETLPSRRVGGAIADLCIQSKPMPPKVVFGHFLIKGSLQSTRNY